MQLSILQEFFFFSKAMKDKNDYHKKVNIILTALAKLMIDDKW